MNSKKYYPLILIALIVGGFFVYNRFFTTENELPKQSIRAIYYWKSSESKLTTYETDFLKKHRIQKVYVKLFEIDVQNEKGAIPISKTQLQWTMDKTIEVVPVVFIRNTVFKHTTVAEIPQLVDNLMYLLDKKRTEQFSHVTFKEVQIDCDWTIKTASLYHEFLRQLKVKLGNRKLSATLRLYPYKYVKEMGVLPVDEAVLMCYNLIPPLQAGQRNSILNINELDKYLQGATKYPRTTSVALPVFSWVHVYKNFNFIDLVQTNTAELKPYLSKGKGKFYTVIQDVKINDILLRKGDQVKIESVSPKQIINAKARLIKHRQQSSFHQLTLFHLDEEQLKQYSYEDIEAFYSIPH